MNFILIVTSSPLASAAANSAYQFCRHALAKNHQIQQVFFYGEGVYHLLSPKDLPQHEINFAQKWQQLSTEYSIQLNACIAATQRRGLDQDVIKTATPIKIIGLGEFLLQLPQADKVIQL